MRTHLRPARSALFSGLAFLISAVGCDPSLPTGPHAVHPVEGRVLFEGKPVAGAQVSLHPVDEAKFGASVPRPTGQTDETGAFTLMTYASGDGAPEGDYQVSIIGQSRPKSEAGNLLDAARAAGTPDVLNGRFTDPRTSGLKATIKAGPNTLEPFQLTAGSGAAPGAATDRRGGR